MLRQFHRHTLISEASQQWDGLFVAMGVVIEPSGGRELGVVELESQELGVVELLEGGVGSVRTMVKTESLLTLPNR